MKKKTIIIGAGGHASVIIDLLNILDYHIHGIIDSDVKLLGQTRHGISVLGNDDILDGLSPNEYVLAWGLAIPSVKEKLLKSYQEKGYEFLTLIHPHSYIAPSAQVDSGSQIMARSHIGPYSHVHSHSLINTMASIDHDCEIASFCHVAPGATLCGSIKMEEKSFIGANSVINPCLHIGKNSTIGSGSVVVKDVEDHAKLVGNPASIMKG